MLEYLRYVATREDRTREEPKGAASFNKGPEGGRTELSKRCRGEEAHGTEEPIRARETRGVKLTDRIRDACAIDGRELEIRKSCAPHRTPAGVFPMRLFHLRVAEERTATAVCGPLSPPPLARLAVGDAGPLRRLRPAAWRDLRAPCRACRRSRGREASESLRPKVQALGRTE